MKLLAIETATDTCSVALQDGNQVRELFEPAARQQTERVLPMVEQLLAETGLALTELDAIAFSAGPGAFTGVRVAVSVAQGLAWGASLPLVPVSTLACTAMAAAQQRGPGAWLVLQDARMNELYVGGYRTSDDGATLTCVLDDVLCAPDQLPALPAHDWQLVGSGVMHAAQVRAQGCAGDWHEQIGPRAAALLPLAAGAWQRGETVTAEQARPVYLRNQVIQGAIR